MHSPEQIAATTLGAVRHARRFGVVPKVALCSHSNFGNQPVRTLHSSLGQQHESSHHYYCWRPIASFE